MGTGGGIGAILQARMRSRRLPGKTMRPIKGRPLLGYVLDRISRCRGLDLVVVCTSHDGDDDAIATYCRECGVPCIRGDHDNVALRFAQTLNEYGVSAFVRVCGDSMFLDPRLIDRAVARFRTARYQIVTNNLIRTFPSGQTVEVVSAEPFKDAHSRMTEPVQCEHVTRYFYENANDYRIFNFTAEKNYAGLKLSVDTQEEFERARAMIGRMDRPHWEYGWRELLARFGATTG